MFTEHERFDGPVWVREDAQIYIVHYPEAPGFHRNVYAVYRAMVPVPPGRMPWTINNRRIADASTLEEAMEIGEKA